MKKIVIVTSLLAMFTLLSACGNSVEENTVVEKIPEKEIVINTIDQPLVISEDIIFQDGEIIIPILLKETGRSYAGFSFDMKNIPSEITAIDMKLMGAVEAWDYSSGADMVYNLENQTAKARISGNKEFPYVEGNGEIIHLILTHEEDLTSHQISIEGLSVNNKFKTEKTGETLVTLQ